MTLNGAIKQLHDIRNSDAMPVYFKPAIAEVINVLLSYVRENVRGEWIRRKDTIQCSQCKAKWIDHTYLIETFRFCPNCGADMRPISALSENVEIVSNLKRGES